MIIGFIIWSLTAVFFLIIGISAGKSKQEAGFLEFTEPRGYYCLSWN